MRKLSFTFGFIISSAAVIGTARADNPNDYKPKVSGMLEVWYSVNNGELPNNTTGINNNFRVRRARLNASGNITDKTTYRFQGAFETSSVSNDATLIDAYIEHKVKPWLRLGGGQYKYLLTLEGTEGPAQIPFVLRPESIQGIVNKLGSLGGTYRDVGAYFKMAFPEKLGLNFNGGIMNGNGGRAVVADNNNHKDYWGKIDLNPLQGLVVGASGSKGRAENRGDAVAKKESVVGAHMEYRFSSLVGLRLRSEYIGGHYTNIASTSTPSASRQPYGYYVAAVYRVPTTNPSTEPNAGWEFGYRWERWNSNREALNRSWLTSHTFGATYRFHNDNRLRANYISRAADTAFSSSDAQESSGVSGVRIGGLFILQYLVTF